MLRVHPSPLAVDMRTEVYGGSRYSSASSPSSSSSGSGRTNCTSAFLAFAISLQPAQPGGRRRGAHLKPKIPLGWRHTYITLLPVGAGSGLRRELYRYRCRYHLPIQCREGVGRKTKGKGKVAVEFYNMVNLKMYPSSTLLCTLSPSDAHKRPRAPTIYYRGAQCRSPSSSPS